MRVCLSENFRVCYLPNFGLDVRSLKKCFEDAISFLGPGEFCICDVTELERVSLILKAFVKQYEFSFVS